MTYSNSQGKAIPEHLWRLGLAVRSLIVRYDAMDRWRQHVRMWVKLVKERAEKTNYTGVNVIDLLLSQEIDDKYALLAAVHDNYASPERNEELIHPWAAEADLLGSEEVDLNSEALDALATYVCLMHQVLPQQGTRGIERSMADRLLTILRDVANNVRNAAKLLTPVRSICADESLPDPVDEYELFLRRDSESEDVRADLTRTEVQEADDVEAPAIDGRQANQTELNQETYSSDLVGNKIDAPTNPLTAAQIAKAIWGKDDDAARKRAREWMKNGKLPANLADQPKDHYVVSASALDLLAKIEGGALNS